MWQIPVNFNVFGTTIQAMAFCLIMSRCIKVEAMLSTADKNKDNTINYCEFRVRPALDIKHKLRYKLCLLHFTSHLRWFNHTERGQHSLSKPHNFNSKRLLISNDLCFSLFNLCSGDAGCYASFHGGLSSVLQFFSKINEIKYVYLSFLHHILLIPQD